MSEIESVAVQSLFIFRIIFTSRSLGISVLQLVSKKDAYRSKYVQCDFLNALNYCKRKKKKENFPLMFARGNF